jgi:hypothetical protein
MNMLNKLKPVLYVALGGLALSIISFIIWISNNKAADNIYFGSIENIATSTFEISDNFNGRIFVNFDENTKLFRGPKMINRNELINGDFIHLTGKINENKQVKAEVIRIMRDPKKEK